MRLSRQVARDSSPDWRVYRVVAVTEEDGNLKNPRNNSSEGFVLSTTASTYCTPHTAFWLSLDGIEQPNAECVLLEFTQGEEEPPLLPGQPSVKPPNLSDDVWTVEFEWDGGRYVGTFNENDCHPRWAKGQHIHATIYNISSL